MYIPTHYAVALFGILLLESGALFVYTLIGLIKSNPLPWMMPPSPQYPTYQYAMAPAPAMAATHTKVVTTTISETILLQQGSNQIQTINLDGRLPPLTLGGATTTTLDHDTTTSTSKSGSSFSQSTLTHTTVSTAKNKVVWVTSTAKPKPVVVHVTTTVGSGQNKPSDTSKKI